MVVHCMLWAQMADARHMPWVAHSAHGCPGEAAHLGAWSGHHGQVHVLGWAVTVVWLLPEKYKD